jgi:hypothetical protein
MEEKTKEVIFVSVFLISVSLVIAIANIVPYSDIWVYSIWLICGIFTSIIGFMVFKKNKYLGLSKSGFAIMILGIITLLTMFICENLWLKMCIAPYGGLANTPPEVVNSIEATLLHTIKTIMIFPNIPGALGAMGIFYGVLPGLYSLKLIHYHMLLILFGILQWYLIGLGVTRFTTYLRSRD